jgi:thioester reductase-like protein
VETPVTTYLLTGSTGLIGRYLLVKLLDDPDAQVHALVRPTSVGRLEAAIADLAASQRDRVHVLSGDLTLPDLGLTKTTRRTLRNKVDHLVHLAALYDMTADDARNELVNVEGTRRVVELAEDLRVGVLHHVSSVAVAGEAHGSFAEKDFDAGQRLPSPYHRTKFEAEKIVRSAGVPWRVYRPAIVLGDSRTGEMDKVDGPYYFFPTIDMLSRLPNRMRTPLVLPGLGDSNVVPVDYVVDAMAALMHRPGLDGRAFHLVHPRPQPLTEVYNAFATQAGAPRITATLPGTSVWPAAKVTAKLVGALPGTHLVYDLTLQRLGVPSEVVPHMVFTPRFASEVTRAELDAAGVPPPPELDAYAARLWAWWSAHLDPNRFRRHGPRGELDGRVVAITGASSGIGRATAIKVAQRGGIPLLLARRTAELEEVRDEIVAAGGDAYVYSVDLTEQDSVDDVVKRMLAEHGGVDMLVNNAGRSIRRSVALSYDRFHDFERTMALNYFAPVRLILALLPSMQRRRFGRIVNVSSIGVQTNVPRFSAYIASKAALDAFSRVVSTETIGDGVTFSVIHMPLVRTPMIAPTKIYDRFPTMTPDEAADVLVDALEHHPKQWGTKLGTLGAVANALTPNLTEAVMHTAYLAFPDSVAAGGQERGIGQAAPEALSRGAVLLARLLPGVHL